MPWHLGERLGVYRWPQCNFNKRFCKCHDRWSKITTGNRCKGRWTLQNLTNLNLLDPNRLTMDSWKIGFFIRNDDKSRDLSPRCFKSRDRSDFENVAFCTFYQWFWVKRVIYSKLVQSYIFIRFSLSGTETCPLYLNFQRSEIGAICDKCIQEYILCLNYQRNTSSSKLVTNSSKSHAFPGSERVTIVASLPTNPSRDVTSRIPALFHRLIYFQYFLLTCNLYSSDFSSIIT